MRQHVDVHPLSELASPILPKLLPTQWKTPLSPLGCLLEEDGWLRSPDGMDQLHEELRRLDPEQEGHGAR